MYDTWAGGANGDNCLYLRELEVYGTADAAPAAGGGSTDIMALARLQQPLVKPASVGLFRRYCLQARTRIAVALLGDGFAACGDPAHPTWVDLFIADLKQRGGYEAVDVIQPGAPLPLGDLVKLREQLPRCKRADLLIIAYGTQSAFDATPTLNFRRQLTELLAAVGQELTVLPVLVTPAPFAAQAKLTRYTEVQGKDSQRLARAAEQVAALNGCALVRTASVLARTDRPISELYRDNVSLAAPGHLALSRALGELLW